MTLKSLHTQYVKPIRKMPMMLTLLLAVVSLLSLTRWPAEATGFNHRLAEADNSIPALQGAARARRSDHSVGAPLFIEEQKLTASDGAFADIFGDQVVASGSTVVVGARADDNLKGSAYVFERQGGSWVETQKLTANDGAPNDQFSNSIAVSGSTIVVGAPVKNIGGISGQGAAYVFERQGGSWVETQKLTASDGSVFSFFGVSISISGSTLVVGAASKGAYVFNRQGGSWVETQKLTASDQVPNDNFGLSVAFSGSTIVVGASFADIGSTVNQGAAYVFERHGRSWVETQKLTASDGAESDAFGRPVAISGSTIVVGAAFFQGSVYVFERRGRSWVETQKLTASDGTGSGFGRSVAFSGSTLVAGASDSAFVFERHGGGWIETQKLTTSERFEDFGRSVEVSGSTVFVGAPVATIDGTSARGAVYVFGP
jgi:FG-GAP repeat